jgi:hypothetical protein
VFFGAVVCLFSAIVCLGTEAGFFNRRKQRERRGGLMMDKLMIDYLGTPELQSPEQIARQSLFNLKKSEPKQTEPSSIPAPLRSIHQIAQKAP